MQSKNLVRWSGLALLIGGILYTINGFFHLDNNDPQSVFSPLWLPLQLMITAFYALSMPGLIGLHLRQRDKTGRLGRIGIVLALVGSAITFITSLGFAFAIPALAAQQAEPQSPVALISSRGPLSWIGVLVLAFIFAFIPGHILTGIATARAGILPHWAGVLVSLGMLVLFLGEASPSLVFLRNIGGVLSGVGLAWLGYALWSEKNTG